MRYLLGWVGALLLALALPRVALAQPVNNGYLYYVQPQDTWFSIAQNTGHSVETLQGFNPQAVRDHDILFKGERLLIPADFSGQAPRFHAVAAGESWHSVANAYGLAVSLLQATNEKAAATVLAPGQRLFVPLKASPASEGAATLPAPSLPGGVMIPAAYQSRRTDPTDIPRTDALAQPAAELVPRAGAAAPPCPMRLEDIASFLADALSYWTFLPEGMARSARDCGLTIDTLIADRDINGDGFNDLLLTYGQEPAGNGGRRTDLALFHWREDRMALALRAQAAGEVTLMAVGDVNEDQREDIVYADKSCGRADCYTVVHVESWDAEAGRWRNWAAAPMAMVNAEVKLRASEPLGNGLAVHLQGGAYNGPEAGPQRARTEIWTSRDGAAFRLADQTFSPTNYLYHVVMEAHRKTAQSSVQDLHAAQMLYRQALADSALETWHDASEREYLRAFSLLRLAIIASYQDQPAVAAEIVDVLRQAYPASVFTPLGQVWHQAYAGSADSVVACAAARAYVAERPATWRPFGAFGYANPPLAATDICPVLDAFPGAEVAAAAEPENVPDAALSLFPSADKLRSMDPATFAASDDLPPCPGALDGYPKMIERLLNGLAGDLILVETWMRICDVMTDEYGALREGDLNGDGHADVVAIVARPEEQGQGPGKKASRMMVYYRSFGPAFNLIFQPPTSGLGRLLALEDLNADGKQNLAWVDEVCNFLCLSTVEVLAWDGDHVNNFIRKGAVIANGSVRLAPVPTTNPGQGKQIVLEGGTSSLIDGERQIDREELWESVNGAPFRRLWIQYDPANAASRCLGLALVEADVALDAAVAYGYGPALQAYRDILDDPTLTACSITGTPAAVELRLLRGLAFFRLIQGHALDGDMRSAMLVVEELNREMPDNPYTAIARAWREAYAAAAHPVLACQAALPLIQAEPSTWQVTDVFGVDHPSETENTLCFVPEAA